MIIVIIEIKTIIYHNKYDNTWGARRPGRWPRPGPGAAPPASRAPVGTCVGGGFKGGGFKNHVIASCVCVTTVLLAILFQTTSSILKQPPLKQPPTQVPSLVLHLQACELLGDLPRGLRFHLELPASPPRGLRLRLVLLAHPALRLGCLELLAALRRLELVLELLQGEPLYLALLV